MLRDAALGRPPAPDLETELMPPTAGAVAAVVAFSGHVVIAADLDSDWVATKCPPGDLMAPIRPEFITEVMKRCQCRSFSTTLTFALPAGADMAVDLPVVPAPDRVSERIKRSHRVRTDVRVYEAMNGGALLVVGRGLAGRWEAGFEVDPPLRGQGIGRALAATARTLVPAGEPLFLQVNPGNIASLRAVLGARFRPVASEVLLW